MKVYLCEKPSQGEDVAKFLGMSPVHKKQGYYQNGDIAVTWARGHLFKLQPPEFYDSELKKSWSFSQLPILPDEYKYTLDVKAKAQWKAIKGLLKKAKEVYIATDPDPEGECIARNILKFAAFKGDVFRVLYGATDKKTLTKAFANPLPSWETEWMWHTALARGISDWVVGMNLTRAMTLVVQKLETSGGFKKAFPVGRVKTPTAMLVYLREQAIKSFKPVKYYEVEIDLYNQNKDEFTVKWDIPERALSDGKLLERAYAEKAVEYILAQKLGQIDDLIVEDKSKGAPLPYELTSLQTACEKFDISPDETLEIAQSLYDKPHSATTYPRTDTEYLTSGLADDIGDTVGHLIKHDSFSSLANKLDLKKRTKAWNDKKVKVHYGIIPTTAELDVARLTSKQKAVYLLISQRYLIQFMDDYVYESTNVCVKIGNIIGKTTCNIPKSLGWRSVEDFSDRNDDDVELPALLKGQKLGIKNARIIEKTTRKPSRYSQASLAKGMRDVSSEVEDPKLRKLLNDKDGIGTVATRPTAIKELINSGLLVEEKRKLKPSRWFEKYMVHIPNQMKEPANTALWERGFVAIKDGQITSDKFVEFQEKFVKSAVEELGKVYSGIK